MTELKNKLAKAETSVKNALYDAFRGIVIIWSLLLVSYISMQAFTPESFAKPTAGLWSTAGLVITGLFVAIHSLFKK